MQAKLKDKIHGAIWGAITGDALGGPVEFVDRESLRKMPVEDMTGMGTYQQPAGTWSDDSSMVLATLDSLSCGYEPVDILEKFCDWCFDCKYTPHGSVFDIGISTRASLIEYRNSGQWGVDHGEHSNGNGSLMRIIPLSVYVHRDEIEDIVLKNGVVSALTHAHIRSKLACAFFSLIIKFVLEDDNLEAACTKTVGTIRSSIPPEEIPPLPASAGRQYCHPRLPDEGRRRTRNLSQMDLPSQKGKQHLESPVA